MKIRKPYLNETSKDTKTIIYLLGYLTSEDWISAIFYAKKFGVNISLIRKINKRVWGDDGRLDRFIEDIE